MTDTDVVGELGRVWHRGDGSPNSFSSSWKVAVQLRAAREPPKQQVAEGLAFDGKIELCEEMGEMKKTLDEWMRVAGRLGQVVPAALEAAAKPR